MRQFIVEQTLTGPKKSLSGINFIWDNVYEYDVTFRHLMAFNPCRSWTVTYNQMWNICMREPLQSRSNFSQQRMVILLLAGSPMGAGPLTIMVIKSTNQIIAGISTRVWLANTARNADLLKGAVFVTQNIMVWLNV